MAEESIDGINAGNVTAWFVDHIDGVSPPLRFELIAGGRSNLTFRVTDAAGRDFALRRPPISHVLATAHDMGREFRIISALAPTPVPVPAALGFCEDPTVNDQPFYVMSFVEGHILRDKAITEKVLDERQRRIAGESLVDVLADLHAVDVAEVGLADLARHDAYIERQLKRWYGQFQQSQQLTGHDLPVVDEVHAFLSTRVPEQQGVSIVHGDYRLDNTMISETGPVAAVLDWEICTLGDRLADVAQLLVYWTDPGENDVLLAATPTTLPGFPRRDELKARYEARTGRDLSALDFYVAFAYWKLACIIEGVYSRYAAGAGGGDRSGFEGMAAQVTHLADAAKAAAERL